MSKAFFAPLCFSFVSRSGSECIGLLPLVSCARVLFSCPRADTSRLINIIYSQLGFIWGGGSSIPALCKRAICGAPSCSFRNAAGCAAPGSLAEGRPQNSASSRRRREVSRVTRPPATFTRVRRFSLEWRVRAACPASLLSAEGSCLQLYIPDRDLIYFEVLTLATKGQLTSCSSPSGQQIDVAQHVVSHRATRRLLGSSARLARSSAHPRVAPMRACVGAAFLVAHPRSCG